MMSQTTNTQTISSERLASNVRRVLALSFFQTFMVIIPVAVPFFASKGLDMQAVFTLQAIFALVIVLCEVPSRLYRRRTGSQTHLGGGCVLLWRGQQPVGRC